MSRPLAVLGPAVLLAVLAGCSSPAGPKPIGEAYIGPATLKLRKELGLNSPESASVRHGDRVDIVARRRRFVKVRTASGAEGWTDMRQLLASPQMQALDELADRAKKLPSQGAATVYEPLNVHTEPNRLSPSFSRVKQGEVLQVVLHDLAPRIPFDPPDVIPDRPKISKKKKEKKEETLRLPKPPAPALPPNWLELSKTPPMPELDQPPPPPKPVIMDDWSLVRLPNGRAGWVVTGMLRMNIPDEVAQYSEGHRITSYFKMADVNDNGQTKHQWLWTTLSNTRQPYQFDSFRYFIWSLRHHRYETAYVERNLKGYLPVEVHSVKVMINKAMQTCPGFSLIVEEDGVKYRKTYAYEIYLVKLIDKQPYREPEGAEPASPVKPVAPGTPQPEAKPPLMERLKRNVAHYRQKWFGR